MQLSALIDTLAKKKITGEVEKEVRDIAYNSQKAGPDIVFVALIGMSVDGHDYISDAYQRGCRIFVVSKDIKLKDATVVRVEDTRVALAKMSEQFFSTPSQELTVIGITGTKGKTTVANYIKAILESSHISCGVIGTNGVYFANQYIETVNTTPESYELQKLMRKMVDAKIQVLVMEVSSSALMMHRVECIDFDYAIFTNLSPDHIGEREHPTFEHYRESKAKLFSMAPVSILNADDLHVGYMEEKAKNTQRFSIDTEAKYKAENIQYPEKISNLKTSFTIGKEKYQVNSFGKFGVYNALAAIVACKQLHLSYEEIQNGLKKAYVKGRLQVLDVLEDIPIIIDYAHNQVSLENVLQTIKGLKPKRIITVFGSIGMRSKHRRIELAEITSKYSDSIIVTSDNPDYEDPQEIIEEIVSHIDKGKLANTYTYVERGQAIEKAIQISEKGDIIVLAGKGHEEYQLINGVREYFSDQEEAIKWAKKKNNPHKM